MVRMYDLMLFSQQFWDYNILWCVTNLGLGNELLDIDWEL